MVLHFVINYNFFFVYMFSQKQLPYKLIIKKSKAGMGLFAGEDIPRGVRVIEYTGERITPEIAEKRGGKYLFEVTDRITIDGKGRDNLARYINHCCKPNGEMQNHRNKIFYYTKRKILTGEELSFDYGEEYFDEIIKPIGCLCSDCESKKSHVSSISK